jgi:uncharacterized LabA/DUF88 family protein
MIYGASFRMTVTTRSPNTTIFWDVENVADDSATHKSMTEKIRKNGTIIKSYAFADWDTRRRIAEELYRLGYDLIHVPDIKENASDYKMASYILDHLIHYPETTQYVLITGDGDFKLLAGALKERGVDLWLISNPLITATELHDLASKYTDIFSFRPALDCINPKDCDEAVQSMVQLRHLAAVQLQEVVRLIANSGNKPGMGHARNVMVSLNPHFNESDLGFGNWNDFLEWAEAQEYIRLEGDHPTTLLVLPDRIPPHAVAKSEEIREAFAFLTKVAEDGLNEGKPYTLRELGIQTRELGLEFEKLGYRRFSDFVLSAEKREMIRIVAPEKEGDSPLVLPVYDVKRLREWFEENVERIFGQSVNVPKAAFLKKISLMLLETRTSLTKLENYLVDESVKQAYSSILSASNIPFLPPFQQSYAHVLIGKGLGCHDVIMKVNNELNPLGIKLQCPA